MSDRKSFFYVSPITRRILAVNIAALLILAAGVFYSGEYEQRVIDAEKKSLLIRGHLLAEGLPATTESFLPRLRQAEEGAELNAFVFDARGKISAFRHAEVEAGANPVSAREKMGAVAFHPLDVIPLRVPLAVFPGVDYFSDPRVREVARALKGNISLDVWRDSKGAVFLTLALPLKKDGKPAGALVLVEYEYEVYLAVHEMRAAVLRGFFWALLVTLLLSIYLSETIARPVARLSAAAKKVRESLLLKDTIPDLSWRQDEIGDLSVSLRDMTQGLAARIEAISRFSADVAHEIKNPLASVKSAAETLMRISDPAQQKRLLDVLNEDVNRLNRLITDISEASRLDADLAREEKTRVDVAALVRETVAAEQARFDGRLSLSLPEERLYVTANPVQLSRVLQNLFDNALSFVTAGGKVVVAAARELDKIVMRVENDGPAIPESKLEAIFERFYSERPATELAQGGFGRHSGLGLSMSRQIIRAHRGDIFATNLKNSQGEGTGVRFTIILPAGAGIL